MLVKIITFIDEQSNDEDTEKITAYYDLKETLDGVDAILFVVPTKVTRLVAKQVAEEYRFA